MKLTVQMVLDRPDGQHNAQLTFDIPDRVIGDDVTASFAAMAAGADIIEGIAFLISHEDDPDGHATAPIPEAFHRAFET